jgi:hypothetical protein
MSHRDTVAALIFLGSGLHFKPIEGPSLSPDADFGELRSDLQVESVLVHPEVDGGVPKSNEPWRYGRAQHGTKVPFERSRSQVKGRLPFGCRVTGMHL